MNLILTPVHKNLDVVKQCCKALDVNSSLPFLHILIDDNSGWEIPVEVTRNRRIIYVKSDVPGYEHKNQLGQMLDLGYYYGSQMFWNESRQTITQIVVLESDVLVHKDWDKKLIEFSKSIRPNSWSSIDCQSVDEEGKTTYPDTVAPVVSKDEEIDELEYMMFQCTLINPMVLFEIRFSDFPSHFDIMFSKACKKFFSDRKFLRNNAIKVTHINGGGNSRKYL